MLERERILVELWKRLASVTGVQSTGRNPSKEPSVSDLPTIQFFEFPDVVERFDWRGGYPVYRRRLTVVIEVFIAPSAEGAATAELGNFVKEVKKKLYSDGGTLGGLCDLKETEMSRIYRPPVGEFVIGVGMTVDIRYVEDTAKLI